MQGEEKQEAEQAGSDPGPKGNEILVWKEHPRIITLEPLTMMDSHTPKNCFENMNNLLTSTIPSNTTSCDTITDSVKCDPRAAVLPNRIQKLKSPMIKTSKARSEFSSSELAKAKAVTNITPSATHIPTDTAAPKGYGNGTRTFLGSGIGTEIEANTVPRAKVELSALNVNKGIKKRKYVGDSKDIKPSTINKPQRTSFLIASPFSAMEDFGSELIAALLHDDLEKVEVRPSGDNRVSRRDENRNSRKGEVLVQNLHSKLYNNNFSPTVIFVFILLALFARE